MMAQPDMHPTSASEWGREDEDEPPSPTPMVRNVMGSAEVGRVEEIRAFADGRYDVDDAGPPPASEALCVMAAPGIVADTNFAEDDWDDDDDM